MTLLTRNAHAEMFDTYETSSGGKAPPTVVFLHGGAWLGGDKSQYKALTEMFTKNGVRVVVANYRLAPDHQHPAPIEDLESTLKTIAPKSHDLFLVGHSAGAHMIAFWNTAHTNAKIKGFIGLEGIYEVAELVHTYPGYRDWFIKKEFGADESKWVKASPTLLPAKSKTPWLVIHSEKDELVNIEQSTVFVKHLEMEKVPVQLFRLKTDSHFGAVESLAVANNSSISGDFKIHRRSSV